MRYLSITLIALFAAAAGAQQVTGVVTTPDGSPIPGVTITVESPELTRTSVTNANGRYIVSLPAGEYSVQAVLDGFSVQAKTVDVAPGRSQSVDFTFGLPVGTPVTGTIRGRVTDTNEKALVKATVTLSSNSATYTLETDSDGNYRKSSLTPGPYAIKASKSGYKTQQKGRTLGDNRTLAVDFELQKQ